MLVWQLSKTVKKFLPFAIGITPVVSVYPIVKNLYTSSNKDSDQDHYPYLDSYTNPISTNHSNTNTYTTRGSSYNPVSYTLTKASGQYRPGWRGNVFRKKRTNFTSVHHSHSQPLLEYLKQAEEHDSWVPFDVPDYSYQKEVFKYLSTRVVSLITYKQNNQGSFSGTLGTFTILAPATEQTRNGDEHEYYLAGNIHVINAYLTRYNGNYELASSFFSFNKSLMDDVQKDHTPSVDDLRANKSKLDHLFDMSSQSHTYNPIKIDDSFSWTATDIHMKRTDNFYNMYREDNVYWISGLGLGADFAVIKANLKPSSQETDKFRYKDKKTGTYKYNDMAKLDKYLNALKENFKKYGEIGWGSTYSPGVKHFLAGYPGNNLKYNYSSNRNHALAVHLELDDIGNPKRYNSNDYLQLGNKQFKTPVFNYEIPYLNLLGGSSGSPMISYNPYATDSEKFKMSGIYWGVTYSGSDDQDIEKSQGMITKLVHDNNYDVIGAKNTTNNSTPKHNSFCSYFVNNSSRWHKPQFCS